MDSNYGKKFFSTTKMSPIDTLKTVSKRVIQKTAEATDDMFGNKIAEKIARTTSKSNHGVVVDNDVVKKLYDKLVIKVNTIDTKMASTKGWISQ